MPGQRRRADVIRKFRRWVNENPKTAEHIGALALVQMFFPADGEDPEGCPLCGGKFEDGACTGCRISEVALTSPPGKGCHHCDEQPPTEWCWWCGRRGTGEADDAGAA